jgi:2-keto-4-pentenoate hydratase/2-oxohepta-3-ene-1,7-dioic acid hydratase in catechol pathway
MRVRSTIRSRGSSRRPRATPSCSPAICSARAGGQGCILELGPENTGGWLKPGDVVELEIERLGLLRTRIVARPA